MSYVVKLDEFEGPLEVLLQLISKSKLSIEEVSLTEITGQYLSHVDCLKQMDIEVASEFLVIAATLLHIKSCKMLPVTRQEPSNGQNEESSLKQKIIEYSKLKQAALLLEEKTASNSFPYYRNQGNSESNESVGAPAPGFDPKKLAAAFSGISSKVLKALAVPAVHTMHRDKKSLKSKIAELKLLFKRYNSMSFADIIAESNDKSEVVITFLALLKMASEGVVKLLQAKPLDGDLIIKRSRNERG